MTDDVFERLAEALDRLPNGFPRTASGVEIRILKKIFSPEEAALASQLTGAFEPVDEIARRTSRSRKSASSYSKWCDAGWSGSTSRTGKPVSGWRPSSSGFMKRKSN